MESIVEAVALRGLWGQSRGQTGRPQPTRPSNPDPKHCLAAPEPAPDRREHGLMSARNFLTDQTVIITSDGSGIGHAKAMRCVTGGAHVAVADLRGQAAEGVARSIRSAGGMAISYHRVDVSDAGWRPR